MFLRSAAKPFMNNIISKIEIDSFRSIFKETIDTDNINIFSGLNDVGKSNVLKALNLFFNDQTDFGTSLNFNSDYSKVSLAAVQRSSKKKQQIKIKIYFKPVSSFKSLHGEELWIERVYDRLGVRTELSSLDGTKQKASLTRMVNGIHYYYIPALKGPEVLQYILGEVGKRKLISESDISALNDRVNNNIIDLAKILTNSSIQTETKFELPVLVEDFWQKLNINTKYDEFDKLDKEINPSKKGHRDALKEEFYQIPLQLRGEGIKSKYIPPLLQWIQDREPNRQYIWGIDEPENSLEFKKAQEIADLYFNNYSKKTQLFLTSHSLAFIFPSAQNDTNIFRCVSGGWGETKIRLLKDLFEKQNKFNLAEEIGALEIQKEIIEEWRGKDLQIEKLHKKISSLTKPVIFVEGSTDVDYLKKTLEVYNIKNYPAEIKWIGYKNDNGNESFTGKDALQKAEQFFTANEPTHKIILFYDVDCNKTIEIKNKLTIYCPQNITNAKYKTGIEHLLNIPKNFNTNKAEFIETRQEGDKQIKLPNKPAIKNHAMKLSPAQQKIWFKNIHIILKKIEKDYLS